jgi:hypothetical protein
VISPGAQLAVESDFYTALRRRKSKKQRDWVAGGGRPPLSAAWECNPTDCFCLSATTRPCSLLLPLAGTSPRSPPTLGVLYGDASTTHRKRARDGMRPSQSRRDSRGPKPARNDAESEAAKCWG